MTHDHISNEQPETPNNFKFTCAVIIIVIIAAIILINLKK